MYVIFDEPVPLLGFAPTLLPLADAFTNVVGHSLFGDLFLRRLRVGRVRGPDRLHAGTARYGGRRGARSFGSSSSSIRRSSASCSAPRMRQP